jgi:tetratricopeptide (TPR) repeat protein
MFEQGHILRQDPFSFTFSGRPWIDHSWLFQLLIYKLYAAAGFTGLIVFRTLTTCSITALCLLIAFRSGAGPLSAAAAGVSILAFTDQAPYIRPHIAAYLLCIAFVYGLKRFSIEENGKDSGSRGNRISALLFLLFIQTIWINTHASFILGPFMAGLFFLDRLIRRITGSAGQKTFVSAGILLAVLAVMSLFATPYGPDHLLFALFSHSGQSSKAALSHIAEWYRIPWRSFLELTPFSITGVFCLYLGISLAGVAAAWKNDGLTAAVSPTVLFCASFWLTFRYGRFMPFSAIMLLPLFLNGMAAMTSPFRFAAVAAAGVYLLTGPVWEQIESPYLAKTISSHYPWDIVSFIKKNRISARLLNSYAFGGFLDFYLYPQCRIFIDGRTPTVFPSDFFWLSRQISRDRGALKKVLSDYDVQGALMLSDDAVIGILDGLKGWSLVDTGEISVLFLSDRLVKKYNLKPLEIYKPWRDMAGYLDGLDMEKKTMLKHEIEAIIERHPDNYQALTDMGILMARGFDQPEAAIPFYQKAIKKKPTEFTGIYNCVISLHRLKRYDEALKLAGCGLKWNPDRPELLMEKALVLFDAKRFREALPVLRQYAAIKDDLTEAGIYKYMGICLYMTGQPAAAIKEFDKALLLSAEDGAEAAAINYNIRNCLAVMGGTNREFLKRP